MINQLTDIYTYDFPVLSKILEDNDVDLYVHVYSDYPDERYDILFCKDEIHHIIDNVPEIYFKLRCKAIEMILVRSLQKWLDEIEIEKGGNKDEQET